jgi:hypothetical protein
MTELKRSLAFLRFFPLNNLDIHVFINFLPGTFKYIGYMGIGVVLGQLWHSFRQRIDYRYAAQLAALEIKVANLKERQAQAYAANPDAKILHLYPYIPSPAEVQQ